LFLFTLGIADNSIRDWQFQSVNVETEYFQCFKLT
jgi:hypothetical protein